MQNLTEENKQAISRIVSDAESHTDCEILVIYANRASHYQTVPLIYACLLSLPLPFLLLHFTNYTLNMILAAQLMLFLAILLLFLYEPIKIVLTPKIHKQARLNQRARDILWSHHHLNRQAKAALLIFIAKAERMAIIETSPSLNINTQPALKELCTSLEHDNQVEPIALALNILTPELARLLPKTRAENVIDNTPLEME